MIAIMTYVKLVTACLRDLNRVNPFSNRFSALHIGTEIAVSKGTKEINIIELYF